MTTDIFTALKNFDMKSVKELLVSAGQKQQQQQQQQQQNEEQQDKCTDIGANDTEIVNEATQDDSVEILNTSNIEVSNSTINQEVDTTNEQTTENHDDTATSTLENDVTAAENSFDGNVLSNSFSFIGDKCDRLKVLLTLPETSNSSTENNDSKQSQACQSCNNIDECSCQKSSTNDDVTDELPAPMSAPTSRRTSSAENPYINRNRRHSSYVSPENEIVQEELRKMRREALLENAQKKKQLLKDYKAKTRR